VYIYGPHGVCYGLGWDEEKVILGTLKAKINP